MSTDNMTKDLKYLVEVTSGFISFVSVQGKEYLKLNSAADINKVVGELDKLFEKAKNWFVLKLFWKFIEAIHGKFMYYINLTFDWFESVSEYV